MSLESSDANRDLYGDLEVDQHADANEIKKSFDGLGAVSHPDLTGISLNVRILQLANTILIEVLKSQNMLRSFTPHMLHMKSLPILK